MSSASARAASDAPPAGARPALQALWWMRRGDWNRAHECVQAHEGEPDCDSVHRVPEGYRLRGTS